jgi:outer membrane lipoprotein SlyB
MTKTRLAIAALVTVGLAGAPFAAEAKKHSHIRHQISTIQSGTYGTAGMSTTQSGTYGTSGTTVGTVTAPSVGSYNWPSVGVTNAVPTWNNTNPSVRR